MKDTTMVIIPLHSKLRALTDRVARLESEVGLHDTSLHEASGAAGKTSAMRGDPDLQYIAVRIDNLQLRLDSMTVRLDGHLSRTEMRIEKIEADVRDLPGMIERGMRSALDDSEADK